MGCGSSTPVTYAMEGKTLEVDSGITVLTAETEEKILEDAIMVLADSFCGTTTTPPEGLIDATYTGVDGQCQPLKEEPTADRKHYFRDVAAWCLRMALPYGGVFVCLEEGKVQSALVTYPPSNRALHEGTMGLLMKIAKKLGKPHPLMEGRRMKALDKAFKKGHIKTPHWYLQMVGVAPTLQGKGFGKRMLSFLNTLADADCAPIYMETTGEKNIAIYTKFGYDVSGRTPVVLSPELTYDHSGGIVTMLRKASRRIIFKG